MPDFHTIVTVALVALATTSSFIIGTTFGLYARPPKNVLACVMAFAAGVLISSLAIELGFRGALHLHEAGFETSLAWAFIAVGFVTGSTIYYSTSRFLDSRGAAVRSSTRLHEYALSRKREDIELLSKSELLRHLPPEAIDELLMHVHQRRVVRGAIVFANGDPGDALYIVARGRVEVVTLAAPGERAAEHHIAELSQGAVFGEMALLSGAPRSATVRALEDSDLLRIDKGDFDQLVARYHELATGLQRLSHDRAVSNIADAGADRGKWVAIASSSLDHLSRRETERWLAEAGSSGGAAIILGDLLDTLPGLFVIGAQFTGLKTLALTVMMGIFVGGLPNSATSAPLLRRAGYSARAIYGFWSITLVGGILTAVAGNVFIGTSESLIAVFAEAMAGGSLLALVTHAMIPEALQKAGSLVVLPTVAGFLFALYVILAQHPV